MLRTTGCDALMIGRGSVINPFLFHQIRAHFSSSLYVPKWDDLMRYLDVYVSHITPESPLKMRVNKLKQLFGFLFKGSDQLLAQRPQILTAQHDEPHAFLAFAKTLLSERWTGN
jgi:tRNA-dihydrouridine synthase C